MAVDAAQAREAPIADVVAGPERSPADDGLAGDAVEAWVAVLGFDLDRQAGVERARGVGADQPPRLRVDEFDAGAVGVEQPGRLVDRELDDGREVDARR